MTYLELINAVLTRLREEQAVTITDTEYVQLIGAIVNEAKRDVEEAWNWTHLRSYVNINTVGGTSTYNITGTNDRTRILDCYNTTNRNVLVQLNNNVRNNYNDSIATAGQSAPSMFDVIGVDGTTGELKVRVWPTPDGVHALRFYCVIPQADLSSASTVLTVPSAPVVQGAYLRAINERGEDQGRLSDIQERLYKVTLGNQIAIDTGNYTDEITWHPI